MASTISNSHLDERVGLAQAGGRLHRLGENVKLLVGLLAIYGPVVLVTLLVRGGILGKTYFVVSIWAIEGIAWYWYYLRALRRRAAEDGRMRYDV
jgi:hypothetical protein